jgi:hypothetical protein
VSVRWLGAVAASALLGCGTPTGPAQSVSQAELALQQADATRAGEHAALELAMAREKLARAESALRDDEYDEARRLADEALVDALLADAKAENEESRETARALQQSIETLRGETARNVGGVGR